MTYFTPREETARLVRLANVKRRQAKLKGEGRCISCGNKRNTTRSKVLCRVCLNKNAARVAIYHAEERKEKEAKRASRTDEDGNDV